MVGAVALAACGPGARNGDGTGDSGDAGIDATTTPDSPSTVDGPPSAEPSKVYAHTADTLYQLNDTSFAVTQIGTFTGLDGPLLDLAVDKNDRMLGTTRGSVYSINSATAAATLLKALPTAAQNASSLSFIPQTTGDDLLVTANISGDVYSINPTTGAAAKIGSYGSGTGGAITSSGDLFGVKDFGVYATVNVGNTSGSNDYLAKIDPANGWKATLRPNDTGFNNIFGLGFWGGKIYGFVDDGGAAGTGRVIEIDPGTGKGTVMAGPSPTRWYGAAVTTDAPIIGRTR